MPDPKEIFRPGDVVDMVDLQFDRVLRVVILQVGRDDKAIVAENTNRERRHLVDVSLLSAVRKT